MKISFICSCIEPGHDGVGDYTRRLAIELLAQKHLVTIISLEDTYISEKIDEVEVVSYNFLPVLRLPSSFALKYKCELAYRYIKAFDPDIISLQFVIFGYHRKGLPFGLGKSLSQLGRGLKWHIMFHELWIGMESGSKSKHVLIGKAQKFLIKNLIKVLKPIVVHTQAEIYQAQLNKLGVNAKYLPLFSNIPVVTNSFVKDDINVIQIVIFGAIHADAMIKPFIEEVSSYGRFTNQKIKFIFVGRCGSNQETWVSICKTYGLDVLIYGEQPPEKISEILSQSTIGVSANRLALIDKSGTAVAMVDHGLPVICVSKPWKVNGGFVPKRLASLNVLQYSIGNIKQCFEATKQNQNFSNIQDVTKSFIDSLKLAISEDAHVTLGIW